MSTYSDYEQRLLDQQSGAELDRRAERAMDHVIDVMHKPPEPPDLTKQLIEDIRTEYDAGAQGYFLPRATMKWLLDALCSAERPSQAPCNPELLAALKGIVPAFNTARMIMQDKEARDLAGEIVANARKAIDKAEGRS